MSLEAPSSDIYSPSLKTRLSNTVYEFLDEAYRIRSMHKQFFLVHGESPARGNGQWTAPEWVRGFWPYDRLMGAPIIFEGGEFVLRKLDLGVEPQEI